MMKKISLILCATAVAMSSPVFADQTGWFVGMSLGKSGPTFNNAPIDALPTKEERDGGYKLWGGYRFTRNFGAEIGYLDTGKAFSSGSAGGCAPPLACPASLYTQQSKARAVQLVGTGALLVTGKFNAFGKLGAVYADTESNCLVGNFSCSVSSRNTDLTYGLGVTYDMAKNLSIRSEWERLRFGDKLRFGDSEVNFFTIGAGYRF